MKNYLLIIFALLGSQLLAQDNYYMAISAGYGKYSMNEMKIYQKQVAESQSSAIHPEMVVSFPGTMNYSVALGRQLNEQQRIGFEYSFQNTAGRNSLIDYSGDYTFDMLLQSHTLGVHYNQRLEKGKIGPLMQLQVGYNFNILQLKESLILYDEQAFDEKVIFSNSSIFIEPMLGVFYVFNQYFSMDVLFGYFLSTKPNFSSAGDPYSHLVGPQGVKVKANWSGLRFAASLYFKIPKKKSKKL